MKNKTLLLSAFILAVSFFLYGCVNVNQKATINKDGSGTIKLEYWTKMSNLTSSKELGGFSFNSEADIKKEFSSSNIEVNSAKMADELTDSTTHVNVDMKFKDLNSLNSAKGYEKVKASWKDVKDGIEFKYVIPQDTSNAKTMGASDYKLTYSFTFPDEIVSTNGRKDGNTVIWDKTLADLKEDLVFTATIKGETKDTGKSGKKCGLFGLELPIVFLAGMIWLSRRNKKNRK